LIEQGNTLAHRAMLLANRIEPVLPAETVLVLRRFG